MATSEPDCEPDVKPDSKPDCKPNDTTSTSILGKA